MPTTIEQQTQTLINHYQRATLIKPNSATVYQHIGNLYRSLFDFELDRALSYPLHNLTLRFKVAHLQTQYRRAKRFIIVGVNGICPFVVRFKLYANPNC